MVKNKGVAVQAGGNVGLWPKRLAIEFEEVHTFEPDGLNFRCMERNVTEENITYYKAALGARAGKIGLKYRKENTGAHQVLGNGDIPMITIDSLNLDGCDLIYLDIEGYEYFALHGAEKTIEKFHPVIVVEYNPVLFEKFMVGKNDIADFLSRFGYVNTKKMNRDLIFIRENENGLRFTDAA